MKNPFLMAVVLLGLALSAPASAAVYTPITGDASYKLTFDEEFNGAALDTSKWRINTQNPGPGSYSNNRLTSANVVVLNGSLDLSVTTSGTTPPYNAGFITTGAAPGNFHFGPVGSGSAYVEARIKMPTAANGAAHGLVPAFWGNGWFTGGPNDDPPEIDFPEWRGHLPSKLFLAIFPTPETTNGFGFVPSPNGVPDVGIDLGAGYNVIGALWTSTQIKWYFNGVLVGTVTNGTVDPNGRTAVVQNNPICLILNNTAQLNGENVDGSTVFPANMLVDYVHVYTNNSGAVAVTPQANYGGPGDNGGGSPDGSTLTAGTPNLVTTDGTWTFGNIGANGVDRTVLLNGASAGGHAAELYVLNGGKMYARQTSQIWYLYSSGSWTQVSNPL